MPAVNLVQNLFNAIFAAFPAIASSFPGGYWPGEAPENTVPPYLVVSCVGASSTSVYGKVLHQDPDIQFSVVALKIDQAMNLIVPVLTNYEDVILPLTGGGSITNMWTAHAPIPVLLGRDDSTADSQNQDDVWMVSSTIHYVLSP